MPFVERDSEGRIVALHAKRQPGAQEELPLEHPDVQLFLDPDRDGPEHAQQLLAESDRDLSRVLEDLITLLAEQNVIRLTDLPPEAQRKLLMRRSLREHLAGHGQVLVDDEGLV